MTEGENRLLITLVIVFMIVIFYDSGATEEIPRAAVECGEVMVIPDKGLSRGDKEGWI